MEPIKFDQSNKTLTAPEGMEDNCNDLHVYNDGTQSISCWQLSEEDMLELQRNGGKIWLHVHAGQSQPPVLLSTHTPFSI